MVAPAENPLEKYFRANTGRLIHKWVHYFDIYHRHFERFRGRQVVIVEFGVSEGWLSECGETTSAQRP